MMRRTGSPVDDLTRRLLHARRMAARAEKRLKQAEARAQSWRTKVLDLEHARNAMVQPTLWPAEEQLRLPAAEATPERPTYGARAAAS